MVNGVDVEVPAQQGQQAPGTFNLPVLPGTHVVTPSVGTKYVTLGKEQTVTVPADPTAYPGASAVFQPTMTDAVEEDAVAQAKVYLTECLASRKAEPEGCPNSVFTFGGEEDYRNLSWSLGGLASETS